MKLPLLARFKLHPSPRPITPEAALSIWNRATDDNRLSVRARFLLQRHCTLAIEELAPLPYSVEEIAGKLLRPVERTRGAAEEAAACGYVELEGDIVRLRAPREKGPCDAG